MSRRILTLLAVVVTLLAGGLAGCNATTPPATIAPTVGAPTATQPPTVAVPPSTLPPSTIASTVGAPTATNSPQPVAPTAVVATTPPQPTVTLPPRANAPTLGAPTAVRPSIAVALQLVAQGLAAPVALAEPADGSKRLFIADQTGLIRIVGADGALLAAPFLDLRSRMVGLSPAYDERGLLGLAFHPDYAKNGRFFVYYSAPLRSGGADGFNHTSHLSEFRVSAANPNLADPASERIILQVDQPQSNHNGGAVAFGPADGYLYLALGDGGGSNDTGAGHVADWYAANPGGNGQDITQNLLGSILRLDVDRGDPYGIPADNPFVGKEGLDEIYAYGFRNPYRFSFDLTGDRHVLWVGDVGQALWEEIDFVVKGGNYGWNVREGRHCFDASNPSVSPANCPQAEPGGAPLLDPVLELLNARVAGGVTAAIIGGYVYHGRALPDLESKYVFGSWSKGFLPPGRGQLLIAETRTEPPWTAQALQIGARADGELGAFLLSLGQDAAGELYALTSDLPGPAGSTGKVYRIVGNN